MPFEVVLPRLGWNMETGRLGEWLKRDGEHVKAGELLFTVEGDKATQDVEALDSGILRIPPDAPQPGEEIPVGTLLGYLVAPDEAENFSFEVAGSAPAPGTTPLPPPEAATAAHPAKDEVAAAEGAARSKPQPPVSKSISPRARRVAEELGVDWSGLTGSGRTGRIVERDVREAAAAAQAALAGTERVSPLAKRLARERGVDVDALAARTPGRRIERADIEAEIERLKAEWMEVPFRQPATMPAGAVLPITTIRRIIAERLATSAHTVAPVTLTTEADATELVHLRKQLKEDGQQPLPSYSDLLTKLVAQALLEHPAVNARFDGDATAWTADTTIVQAETVNIGIAVDTERGLLVPVIRDVQTKSPRQIAGESATLIEKARTGRISPDELSGGTFTITNLGMYEIDAFTPIINLPECAILGVGRIVPKQVVMDAEAERVAIRYMMFLSLTFDHRLVDGAPAARFLQRVREYVAKPYLWLVA